MESMGFAFRCLKPGRWRGMNLAVDVLGSETNVSSHLISFITQCFSVFFIFCFLSTMCT